MVWFGFIVCVSICYLIPVVSVDPDYKIPDVHEEVYGSWEFEVFSDTVRQAIQLAMSFPWEFVSKFISRKQAGQDIATEDLATEVISTELALIIPAGIGLLVAIFVPLCTTCFCCCRCCGNCGGRLKAAQVKDHKTSMKMVNVAVVFVTIGFLGAMACSIPVSGGRMLLTPPLIFESVFASVDDMSLFLHTFIQTSSASFMTVVNTTLEGVKDDLADLPNVLSKPVLEETAGLLNNILGNLDTISTSVNTLSTIELALNDSITNILALADDLQSGITALNNNLTVLKNKCNTDGETFCDYLPASSSVSVTVPASSLQDLAGSVSSLVSTASSVDMEQYNTMINVTFTSLPELISDVSADPLNNIMAMIDDVSGMIEPMIGEALQSANFSVDDMGLTDMVAPLKDELELAVDQYGQYVNLVFLVLGLVLGVVCVFALLGLLLGMLCTDAHKTSVRHGRTAGGNCGSCFLMCSVCVGCVPVSVILLFGSLLLLLGGNMTMICEPIQDYTFIAKMIDEGMWFQGRPLTQVVFGNESAVDISAYRMLKQCKAGGTLFGGVDILANISSVVDVSKYVPDFVGAGVVSQVNSTVQALGSFDMTTLSTFSTDLTLPPEMDPNTVTTPVRNELNSVDLAGTADWLNGIADSLTDPYYVGSYQDIAQQLLYINQNTMQPLLQGVDTLGGILTDLGSTGTSIQAALTGLVSDLGILQRYIQSQATDSIMQALDNFMDSLLKMPDELIPKILGILKTDVGKCKIVADIYDTVTGSFCTLFLDSFNVLWAGMYCGGLLCTVLMIANCCLSKYFRRPDDTAAVRGQYNQNATVQITMPSAQSADVVLTKYRTLSEEDGNHSNNNGSSSSNNSGSSSSNTQTPVFPRSHYQRMRQRWSQRRKFITGPFSAGFFQVQDLGDRLRFNRQNYNNRDAHNDTKNVLINMEDLKIKSEGQDNVGHYNAVNSEVDETDLDMDSGRNVNNNRERVSEEGAQGKSPTNRLAECGNILVKCADEVISHSEVLDYKQEDLLRNGAASYNHTTLSLGNEDNCEHASPLIDFYLESEKPNSSFVSNLGNTIENDTDTEVLLEEIQQTKCPNKLCRQIESDKEFVCGKIVCSLCKPNRDLVPEIVVSDDERHTVDVESGETQTLMDALIADDHVKDFYVYNHVQFEQVVDEQKSNKSGEEKESKEENVAKSRFLTIPVRPYHELEKARSPRSAFLYWKYMEANCSSVEPNTGLLAAEHDQLLAESIHGVRAKTGSDLGNWRSEDYMKNIQEEEGTFNQEEGYTNGILSDVSLDCESRWVSYPDEKSASRKVSNNAGSSHYCRDMEPAGTGLGVESETATSNTGEMTLNSENEVNQSADRRNEYNSEKQEEEVDFERDYDSEFDKQTENFRTLYTELMMQIDQLGQRDEDMGTSDPNSLSALSSQAMGCVNMDTDNDVPDGRYSTATAQIDNTKVTYM